MGTADQISHETKRDRSVRKSMPYLHGVLVIVLLCLAAAVLSGCAGTLEKSVNTCAGLDGSWEYTKAGDIEKFSCNRPSSAVTTRTAR